MNREQEAKWRLVIEAVILLVCAFAVIRVGAVVVESIIDSGKPLETQCEEMDSGS